MTQPVMLLDSAGLWFRAFYGVKETLASPDGRPTNAIRGFLEMTASLIDRERPSRFVACVDLDWRPQFRVDLLPTYKTHRVAQEVATGPDVEETPDGLNPQVDLILELLDAFGIAVAGAEGHEADDVLGTLAAREESAPVIIVSGDRDLLQCADDTAPGVKVLYIGGGLAKAELFDPAGVAAKYQVPTDRAGAAYAELALLRGDPSDGLPGVPGVGEKTAAKLLTQYGSLDAIREAAVAGEIPGRVGANLTEAQDYLAKAWDVVWVRRDAPVSMSGPDALPAGPKDPARLAALAAELGIERSVARLTESIGKARAQ